MGRYFSASLTIISIMQAIPAVYGQGTGIDLKEADLLNRLGQLENLGYSRTINFSVAATVMPNQANPATKATVTVSCKDGKRLITSRNESTGKESVYGNSEYGQFALVGTDKNNRVQDYLLRHFDSGTDLQKKLKLEKQGFGFGMTYILPLSYYSGNDTWRDLLTAEKLAITSVKKTPVETTLISYKLGSSAAGFIEIISADMPIVLSSEHRYLSGPASGKRLGRSTLSLQNDYGPDGLPVPSKYYYEVVEIETQKKLMFASYEFSNYTFEGVADSKFAVTEYGIPQPEGVPIPNSNRTLYILTGSIALGLVLGSVLLYILSLRRKRGDKTSPKV